MCPWKARLLSLDLIIIWQNLFHNLHLFVGNFYCWLYIHNEQSLKLNIQIFYQLNQVEECPILLLFSLNSVCLLWHPNWASHLHWTLIPVFNNSGSFLYVVNVRKANQVPLLLTGLFHFFEQQRARALSNGYFISTFEHTFLDNSCKFAALNSSSLEIGLPSTVLTTVSNYYQKNLSTSEISFLLS